MKENEKAHKEMKEIYGLDMMGKIALEIFTFHEHKEVVYKYKTDAKELYNRVAERYIETYNEKWSNSQEDMDEVDRSEIPLRSKAPELIGRLSIILWIYKNGNYNILKYKLDVMIHVGLFNSKTLIIFI